MPLSNNNPSFTKAVEKTQKQVAEFLANFELPNEPDQPYLLGLDQYALIVHTAETWHGVAFGQWIDDCFDRITQDTSNVSLDIQYNFYYPTEEDILDHCFFG